MIESSKIYLNYLIDIYTKKMVILLTANENLKSYFFSVLNSFSTKTLNLKRKLFQHYKIELYYNIKIQKYNKDYS